MRAAYAAYPGLLLIVFSSNVTPETRINRIDMTAGPTIVHQAVLVAQAMTYRPHQTTKSPK